MLIRPLAPDIAQNLAAFSGAARAWDRPGFNRMAVVSGLVIVPFENFKFRAEARRELGPQTGIVIDDGNFRAFVRLRDGPLQRGLLVILKLRRGRGRDSRFRRRRCQRSRAIAYAPIGTFRASPCLCRRPGT